MHSLSDLQDEQLIRILEKAFLSLETDPSLQKQFAEGDEFSVMIMHPSVLAFTLSFKEEKLHWKIGTDMENPSMTWKEKRHFLEWLEGKRGIMKLFFSNKFTMQGRPPKWANSINAPLRKYISENVLGK